MPAMLFSVAYPAPLIPWAQLFYDRLTDRDTKEESVVFWAFMFKGKK